jgi:hypothetical protein
VAFAIKLQKGIKEQIINFIFVFLFFMGENDDFVWKKFG